MITNKEYLFVGAKVSDRVISNPGGQLTASIGLSHYAQTHNLQLHVLDTTQSSFPIPKFKERLVRGLSRVVKLLMVLVSKRISGAIIFSSSGFSFYERSLIALICRCTGVKTVFFMRDGHFIDYIQKSSFRKKIAKYLLKVPHVIGMQGESWRKFYHDLGVSDSKLITVRNWLPLGMKVREDPVVVDVGTDIHFCFVGWLVAEKGINEILDAVLCLHKYTDSFKVTFVGGGTLENFVKAFVLENNLGKNIEVTGWQNSTSVCGYLSRAHVFLLPSYAEGFPNSLLEAMAYGLPAIISGVGAIGDSINDTNGVIVQPRCSDEIFYAMKQYIDQPFLVEQHSVNILKVVKEQHNRDDNCKLLFQQFK